MLGNFGVHWWLSQGGFFFFLLLNSLFLLKSVKVEERTVGGRGRKRKVTASAGWLALGWFYWQILNWLDGDWLRLGRQRFSCSCSVWELHMTAISYTHICMRVYHLHWGWTKPSEHFKNIEIIRFSVCSQSSPDWIFVRIGPFFYGWRSWKSTFHNGSIMFFFMWPEH